MFALKALINFNCGPMGMEVISTAEKSLLSSFFNSVFLSSTIFPSNFPFSVFFSCFLYLSLNFTFHIGIFQLVTDSCSPPSLTHSSSLPPSITLLSRGEWTGAALTVQKVLEGWPVCVVCSTQCFFDDGTVHFKDKLVVFEQQMVTIYCLC